MPRHVAGVATMPGRHGCGSVSTGSRLDTQVSKYRR